VKNIISHGKNNCIKRCIIFDTFLHIERRDTPITKNTIPIGSVLHPWNVLLDFLSKSQNIGMMRIWKLKEGISNKKQESSFFSSFHPQKLFNVPIFFSFRHKFFLMQ
jgi:hypothetical protein